MSGVPGSDLLADAFNCIETVEVEILRQGPRVKNRAGQYVTDYPFPPEPWQASVQAVNRSTYLQNGLDFTKNYVNIYLSADVQDVERNKTGDKVLFRGRTYEVVGNLDWFELDGWIGLLCVELIQPL